MQEQKINAFSDAELSNLLCQSFYQGGGWHPLFSDHILQISATQRMSFFKAFWRARTWQSMEPHSWVRSSWLPEAQETDLSSPFLRNFFYLLAPLGGPDSSTFAGLASFRKTCLTGSSCSPHVDIRWNNSKILVDQTAMSKSGPVSGSEHSTRYVGLFCFGIGLCWCLYILFTFPQWNSTKCYSRPDHQQSLICQALGRSSDACDAWNMICIICICHIKVQARPSKRFSNLQQTKQ